MILILIRLAGASLVLLALAHVPLARALDWQDEARRLSPLNARVFAAHAVVVTALLLGLGLLSLLGARLLLAPGELPRLLLGGQLLLWLARLVAQVAWFDRAMATSRRPWTRSAALRLAAGFLWLSYVGIYAAALLVQLGLRRS